MKILYLPERYFRQMTFLLDFCVRVVSAHTHMHASQKPLVRWLVDGSGCIPCFFFLHTSLPFNTHVHIPSHAVKSPGLVKAAVPLDQHFILFFNKKEKCSLWLSLTDLGTGQFDSGVYIFTQRTQTGFTLLIASCKIRSCKSSSVMVESRGPSG